MKKIYITLKMFFAEWKHLIKESEALFKRFKRSVFMWKLCEILQFSAPPEVHQLLPEIRSEPNKHQA